MQIKVANEAMMGVTSLNEKIKSLLESTFISVAVEGEVASLTYHTSGHLYFSVKDNNSAIKCVMFRSSVIKQKFKLEVGQHIIVSGSISVYTPRGEYQFYATNIEPFGQGGAALALEQLKKKLSSKGYFDNKKPIPKVIKKLALITAKDSAALHDMLKIIDKRWPLLEVTIFDTLVQGEQAPAQITKALKYADSLNFDTIIIARGGGSSENLWAFNSEMIADAIFESTIPIVSAIGHEIDVMISDFVADLRAPTPSAAIEMILPDFRDVLFLLDESSQNLTAIIEQKISIYYEQVRVLNERINQASPAKKVANMELYYNQIKDEFMRQYANNISRYEMTLANIDKALKQQMRFVVDMKSKYLLDFSNNYALANPRNRSSKGVARVWVDGKLIELSSIKKGSIFTVEDTTATLTVECLESRVI